MNWFKNELVQLGCVRLIRVKFFITKKKIIDSIYNFFVNIEQH